jgi:hypothetical protein
MRKFAMRRFVNPTLPFLFLGPLLVAAAGCSPQRLSINDVMVVRGPVTDGDGSPSGDGSILIQFDMSSTTGAMRLRLNGKFLAYDAGDAGLVYVQTGLSQTDTGYYVGGGYGTALPAGSYVVELVDPDGQVVATSHPAQVSPNPEGLSNPDLTTVIAFFGTSPNFLSENFEPFPRDDDPTTEEVIVRNAIDSQITIEHCVALSSDNTSCTALGTLEAGAETRLTLPITAFVAPDGEATFLRVHRSDAVSPYWDGKVFLSEDLYLTSESTTCQVQGLIVGGSHQTWVITPTGTAPGGDTPFANGTCPFFG